MEMAGRDHAMKFCGMEIEQDTNGVLQVHQQSYLKELFLRHGVESGSHYIKVDPIEEEGVPSKKDVRAAQCIAGEVLWAANRTRPDINFASHRMSQEATKHPKWVMKVGGEILKYLYQTVDYSLKYGPLEEDNIEEEIRRQTPRKRGTVEICTDSSHAPDEEKDVSGFVCLYAGAMVFWHTQRQSLCTLSTAESELVSELITMVEGLQMGRNIKGLVDLLEPPEVVGALAIFVYELML